MNDKLWIWEFFLKNISMMFFAILIWGMALKNPNQSISAMEIVLWGAVWLVVDFIWKAIKALL